MEEKLVTVPKMNQWHGIPEKLVIQRLLHSAISDRVKYQTIEDESMRMVRRCYECKSYTTGYDKAKYEKWYRRGKYGTWICYTCYQRLYKRLRRMGKTKGFSKGYILKLDIIQQ